MNGLYGPSQFPYFSNSVGYQSIIVTQWMTQICKTNFSQSHTLFLAQSPFTVRYENVERMLLSSESVSDLPPGTLINW